MKICLVAGNTLSFVLSICITQIPKVDSIIHSDVSKNIEKFYFSIVTEVQ